MKRIFILFISLFSVISYSQVITVLQPNTRFPYTLVIPDTSVVVNQSLTLDLDNYLSGSDTSGVSYEFINESDTSQYTDISLWNLSTLTDSGDIKRSYSVNGNWISLGQTSYEKGIGLKPNSKIAFDVSGQSYHTFNALVGTDAEGNSNGSTIKIYANEALKSTVTGNAWDEPTLVSFALSGEDSIVVRTTGGSRDHSSLASCFVRYGTEGKINQYSEATLTGNNYYTAPTVTSSVGFDTVYIRVYKGAKADTDTFVVHIKNTYDSLNVALTGGSSTVNDYPVKVSLKYEANMESDFSDVEFFDYDGDTLWTWIEDKVDGDSAIFWVRGKQIDSAGDSIQVRYNYANLRKNLYNNDQYVFNWLENGVGIPTHWYPCWADTTGLPQKEDPPGSMYEREFVVDSAGVLYMFSSATTNYDQSSVEGNHVYLYTSSDTGNTWTIQNSGNDLIDGRWAEDVYVFENPFYGVNGQDYWFMFSEDENRAAGNTYTYITLFEASSLSDAKWTFVDTVLFPTADEYMNAETGTPSTIFRNDTLWVWYEGIGAGYWNGQWYNQAGQACLAYSTDGLTYTQWSGNPQFSNEYDRGEEVTVADADWYWGGFDNIYQIDDFWHGVGHQQLPDRIDSVGTNFYPFSHWLSSDSGRTWTMDPDTTVIGAAPGLWSMSTWMLWKDSNDKLYHWTWNNKNKRYYYSRPFSYTQYHAQDTTGRAGYGEAAIDSMWYTSEGLYLEYNGKEEDILYSDNIRPQTGVGWVLEFGVEYLGGDSPLLTFWNQYGDMVLEVGTTNPDAKWKVRSDSTGSTQTFPNHANGITDSTYYFRVVCSGTEATVYAKRLYSETWSSQGIISPMRAHEGISRVGIGNYWTASLDLEAYIKNIKLYSYIATEPVSDTGQ